MTAQRRANKSLIGVICCSSILAAPLLSGASPRNPVPTPRPFLSAGQYAFLQELLDIHLNYFLSNDAVTVSGLPLGAYKEGDRGRYNYSNPTEWGYTLLAWLIAADSGRITKAEAASKIENALDTMLTLQNDPNQNYQRLFYPYYYVANRGGDDLVTPYHDANHWIPSIDNGFLYSSLLIIEGWARVNSLTTIQNKSHSISSEMNFRMFLEASGEYLAHLIDADSGNLSSSHWDVYADEGGVMAWIAYASDSITFGEYGTLVEGMRRPSLSWNGITVGEAAWFNAMFTWGVRSWAGFPVATWETGLRNHYSLKSFATTVKAHLAYGDWLEVYYPAFSDAMTQVGCTGHYTPPNIPEEVPTSIGDHVVPHAFFVPFCIGPDLETDVLTTLFAKISDLKTDAAGYYHDGTDGHKPFGFEVTSSPHKDDVGYVGVESRYIYETLSHAYIVLSIYQGLKIHDGNATLLPYACEIPNYFDKVEEVLDYLYPVSDNILRVPEDYPTIQDAINAAVSGDTILVAAGTYSENLYLDDEQLGLTLKGTIGDYDNPLNSSLNTVINGSSGIRIAYANMVLLDELVIAEARRSYYGGYGGGIWIRNSENVTVTNSIIFDNMADYGSGICSANSKNTVISYNIFKDNNGHHAGAIYIYFDSYDPAFTAEIIGNEIIDNYAWVAGAGIRVDKTYVSIRNNLIYNNLSDSIAGIYLISVKGEVKNNLIIKNVADHTGTGAIGCNNSPVAIVNNVVHKNRAFQPYANTGGIRIWGELTPTIKNNIITENEKEGIYHHGDSPPSLTYNNVYNNQSDYYGCTPGVGSISEPPLFVAPDTDSDPYNDDYHLQSQAGRWDPNTQTWVIDANTSICVDAGNPGCPLGNEPNDPNNIRINIGAYGGTAEASKSPANWALLADLTNDRMIDFNDLKVFVLYWLNQGRCIPSDINRDQSVDFADFALTVAHWLEHKNP